MKNGKNNREDWTRVDAFDEAILLTDLTNICVDLLFKNTIVQTFKMAQNNKQRYDFYTFIYTTLDIIEAGRTL